MKRIWFTQQKPFKYLPLLMGLGYFKARAYVNGDGTTYVPKIYTTRTHALKGQYQVVEGSRFKAVPVVPEIKFQVRQVWELNLRKELIMYSPIDLINLEKDGFSFAELDLGYFGSTFQDLKNELLKLNKKATVDTTFYINLLEPIEEMK